MIEPKTICFSLTKKVDNSPKDEIVHTIERNEYLAEDVIKN